MFTANSTDRLARGIREHISSKAITAIKVKRLPRNKASAVAEAQLSAVASELLCRRSLSGLGILAAEPLHTPCRVHQALFAGEKRVAVRADFDVDVALVSRPSLEMVSAGAHNLHRGIVGMNLFLGHR